MKAVVYHAPGDVRVEQIDKPCCGDGELLVKVDACAVCGTDLKSYHHGNPRIRAPLVMGHEFTGMVEAVRPRRGRLRPRPADRHGHVRLLRRVLLLPPRLEQPLHRAWRRWASRIPGGMAEYTVMPALALRNGHVVKVPPHVRPEHAALAEPVSCAVNSLENCRIEPGDTVVVLGAGPMGLMNVCVARGMGAGKIILSELSPVRLAQARQFVDRSAGQPGRAGPGAGGEGGDRRPGRGRGHRGGSGGRAPGNDPAAGPQARHGLPVRLAAGRGRDALDQQPARPLRRAADRGHQRLDARATSARRSISWPAATSPPTS